MGTLPLSAFPNTINTGEDCHQRRKQSPVCPVCECDITSGKRKKGRAVIFFFFSMTSAPLMYCQVTFTYVNMLQIRRNVFELPPFKHAIIHRDLSSTLILPPLSNSKLVQCNHSSLVWALTKFRCCGRERKWANCDNQTIYMWITNS